MFQVLQDHLLIVEHTLKLQCRPSAEQLGASSAQLRTVLARVAKLPPPRVGRLELSPLELYAVHLLLAIELEPVVAALARQLGAYTGSTPTIEGLRRLMQGGSDAGDVLSARRSLRRLRLIEPADGDAPHESAMGWVVSRRVVCELRGEGEIDAEIADMCARSIGTGQPPIVYGEVMNTLVAAAGNERNAIVIAGPPSVGKRTLVRSLGRTVLEIDMTRIGKEADRQLTLLARECAISGAVPLLANLDKEHVAAVGRSFESLVDGPIIVTCGVDRPHIKWSRPVVVVEMPEPTTVQRAELWKRGLDVSDGDADLLAERYPLAPGLIVRAAEAAKARANGRKLGQEDVFAGIRAVLDDKLGTYAKRVNVTQTWDDLVLPQEQLDPIVELMARVRGRRRVYEQWGFAAKVGKGLGVSALFSGPPGTGKTMVAALIAKELGLELYQVDMAKLVSKYIGETEKHLAAMFDAAEAGHAILLFDECDSLFGRRTEVRTSNDRYANLETNYLLQRLESFTGICLLTTNHESNLDPAFHRRLSLHVRFDLPDERERAKLWRAVLPAAAPVNEDVDFAGLARRYEMSGGYIKNAALRAAFLAADEDAPIGAAHLERAARVEYEAMGKLAA